MICSSCDGEGHDRRACKKRRRKKKLRCNVCEDQPHRRNVAPFKRTSDETTSVPEDPTRTECRGCGKPYIPEPAMTIVQSMELPRESWIW